MIVRKARGNLGFSLGEVMLAAGLGSLVLAGIFLSATALKKSFSAIDKYFATHVQQIRIIDYLSRDVKRSTIVQTSVDRLTVKCWIPNYIIKATDPDGLANPSLVGTRRTPVISRSVKGFTVDYGSPNYAVAPPTGVNEVEYYLNGTTIIRKENGDVTSIASSTDQLIPESIDVQTANTEYTISAVTFMPTFITNSGTSSTTDPRRLGTSVYSLAYLRNLRRGN
jgi:hypothetical protein